MKNLLHFILSMTFLSGVTTVSLSAQQINDNESVLKEAKELFDAGTVERIPSLLDPFIEKGFDRKQKKEAYILIIKSYLFDDLQQQARKSLVKFLNDFPEYEPTEDDPKELQYIYQLHKPYPVFSIGPLAGINISGPSSRTTYNVSGVTTTKTGVSSTGNQFGLQLNGRITGFMDIRLDFLYGQYKYGFEQMIDQETVKYNETLSQISVPVWLSPYLSLGKHRLYLKLGGGVSPVIGSSAEVSSNSGPVVTYNTTGKLVSMNYFMGTGAGFSLKIPTGFISVEGSYLLGAGNMVNGDNRESIADLQNTFSFVDDDYKLNSLMISVSYVFVFYKVSEKK